MKINELKGIIEEYSKEELLKIIPELYKSISKSVKDSKNIDEIIKNISDIKNIRKNKKEIVSRDIFDLKEDVEQFIEYAYNQYYYAPNRYVPKKKRSQWRFLVKRFYKEITALSSDKENLSEASDILTKLYELLCYSCDYYTFNTYDTFEAIGIEQPSFYHKVILLKYGFEEKRQFIRNSIELIINGSLNRYTLDEDLVFTFLDFLKTPDLKELTIDVCTKLTVEIKQKNSDYLKNYKIKDKLNILAQTIFYVYVQLYEYDNAINYFELNYFERRKEIKLYIKLKLISNFSLNDLYIQQYESAIKYGIKPREELRKNYDTLKKALELDK